MSITKPRWLVPLSLAQSRATEAEARTVIVICLALVPIQAGNCKRAIDNPGPSAFVRMLFDYLGRRALDAPEAVIVDSVALGQLHQSSGSFDSSGPSDSVRPSSAGFENACRNLVF